MAEQRANTSFAICHSIEGATSRWSGLNRRPAHYECAALPLSYTGGLESRIYRAERLARQGYLNFRFSRLRVVCYSRKEPSPALMDVTSLAGEL
jgi:hypothetical protein